MKIEIDGHISSRPRMYRQKKISLSKSYFFCVFVYYIFIQIINIRLAKEKKKQQSNGLKEVILDGITNTPKIFWFGQLY